MRTFLATHEAAMTGTLSCFDRVLFKGMRVPVLDRRRAAAPPGTRRRCALDIRDAVRRGLREHPTDAAFVADIGRFVVLQRLFRAALEGHLGPRFPMGKLGDLAAALKRPVDARTRTPRWNPRLGLLEMQFGQEIAAAQLMLRMESAAAGDAAAAWVRRGADAIEQCSKWMGGHTPNALSAAPAAEWEERCGFGTLGEADSR